MCRARIVSSAATSSGITSRDAAAPSSSPTAINTANDAEAKFFLALESKSEPATTNPTSSGNGTRGRESYPRPPDPRDRPFSVMQSDNIVRVPDGYNSKSTRGHARALATRDEVRTCRTKW